MEALIVATFTLGAIVLLEAGYAIAITLLRWTPVIAVGVISAWLALRHDIDPVGALGVAMLACMVARHVLRRR